MSDEIFSRSRRRLIRKRALLAPTDSQWLLDRMAEDLVDRLSFMTVDVRRVLVIGHGKSLLQTALPPEAELLSCDLVAAPGVDLVADEDRLLFPEGGFDLVFACGTLDTVDDLPGALLLIRRALRPGGLFLGAMLGAGSLSYMKRLFQDAESEVSAPAALRFHPQIEVRSAGDLLFRAGFATPVADQETVEAHYKAFQTLCEDIRGNGAANALRAPQALPRDVYRAVLRNTDPGPLTETFAPIYMTGWSPMAGEARPAGPTKGFL